MTIHNPILDAVPNSGTPATGDVQAAFASAFALFVEDSTAIASEDFTDTPYRALIYGGDIFPYDENDTTTAHDGITVIVVSGRRYKRELGAVATDSVIDKDLVAQPESPTIGDAYILPAAPTGADWSSKANHYTLFTSRGWVFVAPTAGLLLYVTDEESYYRYDEAAGAWLQGVGDLGLSDGGIQQRFLENPLGFHVEDERNDPPVSPVSGNYYIVGTVPTGDWSTDSAAAKIAHWDGTAWEYITPKSGDRVFNDGNGLMNVYETGAWSSVGSGSLVVDQQSVVIPATEAYGGNFVTRSVYRPVFEHPFRGRDGDVLCVDVQKFIVEHRFNSDSISDAVVQLFIQIDDAVPRAITQDFDVDTGDENLSSVYTSRSLDPLKYWLDIDGSDEHTLRFGEIFFVGSGANAYQCRVEIDAEITVWRKPIIRTGIISTFT